ncbi:Ldh family oxidoreductase [Chelativorans intermedius]|uniref:Ldh family oxidoreductase n=1 Tax=Chelativorans intermedius TaxID=515947 RepID=A0ABV6DAL7_9HYPH|nr:Ldh family oxidoreductase [Chelativorans intermedius]MCT9000123.1 Ldh family oxidoreductase [Chelativorans intermedius]
MTSELISIEAAHKLIVDALVSNDTSPQNARSVADALTGAELAGQSGHGLRRVPAYAAQTRAGKVKGHAVPTARRVRPGVVRIDAANGFAFPALDLAVGELAELAPQQGIAMAGIHRSHHAGVAGLTVEALARRGLVGLMFANAPAAMAPWGGRKALFGTNPIAFAAPVAGAEPVVVDVSLSKVARGKLMAARQKNMAIPEGWALDPEGNPTTDPAAGMAGTMVPLGDAKGTALALMVELLCAGLTGANFAYEQSSFFDDAGDPPGTGQALIAVDPLAFGPGATERFAEMVRMIDMQEGARVPGHRRREIAARVRERGVEVDTSLLHEIKALIV